MGNGTNSKKEFYDSLDKAFGKYKFHLLSPFSKLLLILGFFLAMAAQSLDYPISLISLSIGILILLNYKNWRLERVIHEAALLGDLGTVETCLASGLDIEIKDIYGFTALHYAIKGGM